MIAPAGWAANRWGSQRLVLASGLLTLVGVLVPRAPASIGLFVAALVYGWAWACSAWPARSTCSACAAGHPAG